MKTTHRWITSAITLLMATGAAAETDLQPGLWEHSFKVTSKSGEIEAAMEQARKMLASLPAEQRQMVEDQMAARGINLDLESYTAKVCITPEQPERKEFPQPTDNCSQSVLEEGEETFKVRFSCDGNPPTQGEGEIRLLNEKQYRGTVTINATINGQAEEILARQNGNWLEADCGSVGSTRN